MTLGSISELAASGIIMNGARTLTFTGNNTWFPTISNGTLEVDGSNQGTGNVTVETNAALTGVGLIAGPVTIAAGSGYAANNATDHFCDIVRRQFAGPRRHQHHGREQDGQRVQ